MNTQSHQVLTELKQILDAGRSAFLVTVLETWGASPRPAGSVLVFDYSFNRVFGSVSGGCVEEDLLATLHDPSLWRTETFPQVQRFGADASGHALPCGAEISLLIEHFESAANSATYTHLTRLLALLDQAKTIQRVVDIEDQRYALMDAPDRGATELKRVEFEEGVARLTLGSPDRLLIVGATDVAAALLPLAEQIGYQVQVCEPRNQQLNRQSAIDADYIVSNQLPDDLVSASYSSANCAVVALAHDPRIDDLAIIAALAGKAHFIGALGSLTNATKRAKRLGILGVPEDQLARLNAPIGLQIGSRTPIEIAISIAAQLISVRAQSSAWTWVPDQYCATHE